MKIPISILAIIAITANEVSSLNILGLFPYQGKSHFYVFDPYLRELTKRGHNVTLVSHFPLNIEASNYRDISLAGTAKIFEDIMTLDKSFVTLLKIPLFLYDAGTHNCEMMLAHKDVQNLWKSKTKFDVILVEQFNSDCSLGLAYHIGAPVVALTSHTLMPWHYNRFGVPFNPAYISPLFLDGGTKPTLYQRFERTLFEVYYRLTYKYCSQRIDEETLSNYFENTPPLEELAKDIKILLWYMHFSITGSRLLPPQIQEVNGYHVAKPKPLSDVSILFYHQCNKLPNFKNIGYCGRCEATSFTIRLLLLHYFFDFTCELSELLFACILDTFFFFCLAIYRPTTKNRFTT